jgi:hypothetical protein
MLDLSLSLPHEPGRWCFLSGEEEVKNLEYGMDFRHPRYRREVFLRFYEYHLKHRAHPGGVYYAMPHLVEKYDLGLEQRYWMAYINGLSQNIVTTHEIFQRFPDIEKVDVDELSRFFREHYPKFGWDTDRRYVKNQFEKCVKDYLERVRVAGSQEALFEADFGIDPYVNFRATWGKVMDFYLFGRLSTFSYLEYLRIMGMNIDCDSLFLDDMDGSKSHRNGLCKVLGRDDLDWHDKLNPGFKGYTESILDWLKIEGQNLLNEARQRMVGKPYYRDVSYFTLESTLCNYKSWHRKNRRYPNVYSDMFHDRIKYGEKQWGKSIPIFWEARKVYLPDYLRLEDNPNDPGVCPEKQNHYRLTGQPIMMHREYDCFKNDFNDRLESVTTIEGFVD